MTLKGTIQCIQKVCVGSTYLQHNVKSRGKKRKKKISETNISFIAHTLLFQLRLEQRLAAILSLKNRLSTFKPCFRLFNKRKPVTSFVCSFLFVILWEKFYGFNPHTVVCQMSMISFITHQLTSTARHLHNLQSTTVTGYTVWPQQKSLSRPFNAVLLVVFSSNF